MPPRVLRETGRATGIEVVEVVAGSPAANAHLVPGDLIIDVDGVPVNGMEDLQRLTDAEAIGRELVVFVYRGDLPLKLTIKPVELRA